MKTAELTGELLDYWVAKAEGHEVDPPLKPGQEWPDRKKLGRKYEPNYIAFSTQWQFGGPIIERMAPCDIFSIVMDYGHRVDWYCGLFMKGERTVYPGENPLIAAMRAKVASVYGDEVPDHGN